MEMHEHLFTRGHTGQNWELKHMIMSPANCVLLHPGACHRAAQHTEAGFKKCVIHLLHFEGYNAMMNWLDLIGEHSRSGRVDEVRQLIQSIKEEIDG